VCFSRSPEVAVANVVAITAIRTELWHHHSDTQHSDITSGAPSVRRLDLTCNDVQYSNCTGEPDVDVPDEGCSDRLLHACGGGWPS